MICLSNSYPDKGSPDSHREDRRNFFYQQFLLVVILWYWTLYRKGALALSFIFRVVVVDGFKKTAPVKYKQPHLQNTRSMPTSLFVSGTR